ncbi:MAG: hypothetical protein ACI379_03200 [Nocardioides sp.]|uniref:hypothetical protein n=1 Tax=Nocardioides sp. TaxID=35761 RepID=UPI003F064C80
MSELIVPARFNGPPTSGNGGWTAGALASQDSFDCPDRRNDAWPSLEVSLRQPPPLDTPMRVSEEDGVVTASFGGAVVATARRSDHEPVEVDGTDPVSAARASEHYPGLVDHPFATCFSCGPARGEGDGLRIFPGPLADGTGRLAATWTPHPSLAEDWHTYVDEHARAGVAATWAALDCIGGWAGGLTDEVKVLGRMTARLDALPVVGEEHVVVGEPRGREGRKTFTAATLYDSDGRVVATAEHVWITVDPAMFAAPADGAGS